MREYSPLTAEPYQLQQVLGYRITEWREGLAVVELALTALHTNRHGTPHGGIYATLIDTAAGFSGTYAGEGKPPRRAMTLSLNCNFIALPRGTRLIATGRRSGGGRRSFFASVELHDETGLLIATGQAALRYRDGEGDPRLAGASG